MGGAAQQGGTSWPRPYICSISAAEQSKRSTTHVHPAGLVPRPRANRRTRSRELGTSWLPSDRRHRSPRGVALRIAWAIPCVWVRSHAEGLLQLIGAQVDSVVVESLPVDVQIDVAIRVVGTVQDFRVAHAVQVVLSDPHLVELGELSIPVGPRMPGANHIPGYEINRHVATRISIPAEVPGGYDLSFALDREPAHEHKTTVSVVLAR